jgi:murein DD-endopeptidase MepM/ murein hydrolase activator NlpD
MPSININCLYREICYNISTELLRQLIWGKLRNSIDFIVDEETPVLAADDGIVIFVKDSSNIGGPNPFY